MQIYKTAKIIVVLLVHTIWCILIFVRQTFTMYTDKNFQVSYNLNILFNNTEGIKKGTPINYRGVKVGEVLAVNLHSDYVIVTTYIKSSKILIPLNAYIKTYKTIFMADTTLHIYNRQTKALNSLKQNTSLTGKERINLVNSSISFCSHNDFLYGFQGTSFDNLIDVLVRLSIQLDNIELLDLIYNIMRYFSEIVRIFQEELSTNI